VEGAVKTALKSSLAGSRFRVLHHESKAHAGLQVADYCCWAIQRRWERGLDVEYMRIRSAITSEFDLNATKRMRYY
jgi:hypothetical protein